MAFVRDSYITDDADFVNCPFEPNLARFLIDIDETMVTYQELHISANNAIMDILQKLGFDPSKVNNTGSFKQTALYYVLMHIYLGRIEEPDDVADIKYLHYKGLWESTMENPTVELTEEDTTHSYQAVVSNVDDHSRIDNWTNQAGDNTNA